MVSLSPHKSESKASPESNSPTTVQTWLLSFSVEPTPMPANCRIAPLPTSSSRNPGLNLRPAMIFTFGRTAHASAPTPRSETLASWPLLFFGSDAITTSSGDAIGWPCASRATPGCCWTSSALLWSSTEFDSLSDPARVTSTVSSLPVPCRVAWKPSAIASSATNTPTTPAMPITITDDAPQREGRVAMPTPVTESVCLPRRAITSHRASTTAANAAPYHGSIDQIASAAMRTTISNNPRRNFFMGISSSAREGIHDFQAHAADCRQHSHDQSDHDHQPQRTQPYPVIDVGDRERRADLGLHAADHPLRQQHADDAPDQYQQYRFGEHQQQHDAVGKSERLQHRQLGNPFAHRLRHGVAGQQDQREEHRRHDRLDDQADVADLLGEGGVEGVGGLGLGFMVGIGRQRVDRLRDLVGILRAAQLDDVPAHRAIAELARFVEVLPVEQQLVLFALQLGVVHVEDADQVEGPGIAAAFLRPDGGVQRRSEEHTSELQSPLNLVCRLLL